MPGIDWVEAVAENLCPGHLPESLLRLRERGVTVVPHGVSLGLGGADRPAEDRLTALAERAEALGSPLVTEHIAFVRAGGPLTASPLLEAGHLLPVPRTRDALDVLCENVRIAQDALPVPLAVENIAALIAWPGEELTEGQFLYELADRTGVRLLIDVANLHTNHVNRGEDPAKALAELPVEAIAYVHVAGGFERDGVWHDSHAHPVPAQVLGHPHGPRLPGHPAGRPAGAGRQLPRGGRAGAGAGRDPRGAGGGRAPGAGRPGGDGSGDGSRAGGRARPGARLHPRPTAPRPRADRAALRARRGDARAGGVRPGAAGGAVAGARRRKRADVVAKVAPELPEILGAGYRPAFLAYAHGHPMSDGYRHDALDFAAYLLFGGQPGSVETPETAERLRRLREWWLDRSGPAPRSQRPTARLARATRRVLLRR